MKKRALFSIFCLIVALFAILSLSSCGDEECVHQFSEWTQTQAPTCDSTGERSRSCSLCTHTETEPVSEVDHIYENGEWSWDAQVLIATYTLKCTFNPEHTAEVTAMGTLSSKTDPTCAVAGAEIYTASVELLGQTYTDTYTKTLPATGNHNFVDSKCTICNLGCEHTEKTTKVLDLSERGSCKSIIRYEECNTCKAQSLLSDPFIACDTSSHSGSEEHALFKCKYCDTSYETTYENISDGCSYLSKMTIKVSAGTEVLLDASYEKSYEDHDSNKVYLDLREHDSSCYNYIKVEKCLDCGKITGLDEYKIFCKGESAPVATKSTVDGVEHSIETVDCTECDLKTVVDTYIEEGTCTKTKHIIFKIYGKNDELLYEIKDETDLEPTHEPEYEYYFPSTSAQTNDCTETGCFIYVKCKKCDLEYGATANNHELFGTKTLDMSAYEDFCGGKISYQYCLACEAVISVDFSTDCTDVTTNDESSSTSQTFDRTCNDCGFRSFVWQFIEKSGCTMSMTRFVHLFMGTTELLSAEQVYSEENHQYKYKLTANGDDCEEDGVICEVSCKNCEDYSSEYTIYYHNAYNNAVEYDLSDYDESAFGTIIYGVCPCGKTSYFKTNVDAGTIIYEITSDDNTTTKKFETLNGVAKITHTSTFIKNSCQITKAESISMVLGDDLNVNATFNNDAGEDHNLKDEKVILVGDSCVDGVYIVRVCEDCDLLDFYVTEAHQMSMIFRLDTSKYPDICGTHDFNLYACPCKIEYHFESYDMSSLETSYTQNSIRYSCTDCNYSILMVSDMAQDGCNVSANDTITLYNGESVIYTNTSSESYTSHNFVSTFAQIQDSDRLQYKSKCSECSLEYVREVLLPEIEYHDGNYYYDVIIEPTKTQDYYLTSLCDFDTYATLYEIVDGEFISLSSNDDDGENTNFLIAEKLTEGKKYALRVGNLSFSELNPSEQISVLIANDPLEMCTSSRGCEEDKSVCVYLPDTAQSCEDGVYIASACRYCAFPSSIEISYSHQEIIKNSLFLDSGEDYCFTQFIHYECLCGEEVQVTYSMDHSFVEASDTVTIEGVEYTITTNTCSSCSLVFKATSHYETVDCEIFKITKYEFTGIDGEILLECDAKELYETNHTLTASYELLGESCEDGIIETVGCNDCDYEQSYDIYHHVMVEEFYLDTSAYDMCDHHSITVYKCLCGADYNFHDSSSLTESTEVAGLYTCSDCSLTLQITSEDTSDDPCIEEIDTTYVIKNGTTELYSFTDTSSMTKEAHNYVATGTASEITLTCSNCSDVITASINFVELVYDEENGIYSYEFEITPTETATYTIYSNLDSSDVYVNLYSVNDNGGLDLLYYDDDSGDGMNFSLTAELEQGVTYVYSIQYNDGSEGYIPYVLINTEVDSHEGDTSSEQTSDINNGATVTYCKECGYIYSVSEAQ